MVERGDYGRHFRISETETKQHGGIYVKRGGNKKWVGMYRKGKENTRCGRQCQ